MSQHLSAASAPEARQRLMIAALDQFTRRGYAATSIRELCEAAGVTKPVLYYYFKNKEGLYLQLMEESYAQFEAALAELTVFDGTVRDRLIHFCHGLFCKYLEQLPLVRLMYSVYYGTPQGAPYFDVERYYDRLLQEITTLIEEGVRNGELRSGSISDMVWTLLACLTTAIEEQLCHANPRIDASAMCRMIGLVLDGIAQK